MYEIHVGDIGTKLRATLYEDDEVVDLQSATVKQYIIKKPGNVQIVVDCSFVTDGTDGKIEYTSTSETFDSPGYYKLQGYIEIAGNKWHTDTTTFRVHPNLD